MSSARRPARPPRAITNQGEIRSAAGGQVLLIAGAGGVRNEGLIEAAGGQILLAAGGSVELLDTGTPRFTVKVTAPQGEVLNLGSINAAGRAHRRAGRHGQPAGHRAGGLAGARPGRRDRDERRRAADAGGRQQHLGRWRPGRRDPAARPSGGLAGRLGGQRQRLRWRAASCSSAAARRAAMPACRMPMPSTSAPAPASMRMLRWPATAATSCCGATARRGPTAASAPPAAAPAANGGFIETSGGWLDARPAALDVGAAHGLAGTWLLDPFDITISDTSPDTGYDPGFTANSDGASISSARWWPR